MLRLRCRSAVVTIEADFAAPRFAQWLAIEGEHGTVHASIDPAYPSRRRVGGFERRLEGSDTDLYLAQARAFLDAVAAPDRPNPICTLREASATARILTSLA